jgi:hypothetical protein
MVDDLGGAEDDLDGRSVVDRGEKRSSSEQEMVRLAAVSPVEARNGT